LKGGGKKGGGHCHYPKNLFIAIDLKGGQNEEDKNFIALFSSTLYSNDIRGS
jgi:hypothetical protein